MALHDVSLDVLVTNTANRPITLVCLPTSEVYTAMVSGPGAESPRMTETGARHTEKRCGQKRAAIKPQLDMRGYQRVTLLPTQTFKDNFALSDLYQMAAPGIYTVKVRRDLPEELGGGMVESDSVTITVTCNPAVAVYGPQMISLPPVALRRQ